MGFPYRIGLDVGVNSLGWCVLELNEDGIPCRIVAAGSRIFSDGRDIQSKATLQATRREARSARRRRDRFKQRQKFLMDELQKAGLFPTKLSAMQELQRLNPLEFRAKALNEKLPPHHIGRALFHLNQRRGFKSNRKDRSEETRSGKVSNSVRLLLEEMKLIDQPLPDEEYKKLSKNEKKEARKKEADKRRLALGKLSDNPKLSYGSFLWERQQRGLPTRARPGVGDNGKLYDVYPQRELYEDEFAKIWSAQANFHSDSDLFTEELKTRIHTIIFTQRQLKPQIRGMCAYLPNHQRTFRAMPSFQRYRIYQDVNNLEWIIDGKRYSVSGDKIVRDRLVELLERPSLKEKPSDKNALVSFHKMKTELRKLGVAEGPFSFNFETPKRKGFDGNLTSNVMQHEDYVGPVWHEWDLEKQDGFIEIILDDGLDDKDAKNKLIADYGLSEHSAENCINSPIVDGTANVSLEAARMILTAMRNGVVDKETGELILPIQPHAVEFISRENNDFVNPFIRAGQRQILPSLPYYGEAFQDGRHIIPGERQPHDKQDDLKYFGGVTNPTVHVALNQIRQVINELIKRYGHPASIAVELGRNLPAGQEARAEIEREQKKNQERNERLDNILREYKQQINHDNRLRLILWEELDETDSNGRLCPFSGKKISITDLFNGTTEIEHLIPFSDSLDDSRANKVICTRKANRDKGNMTPFRAFGHSPSSYKWNEISQRVTRLPKHKQWRFQENALEIWYREHADFTERHLNDTRYIGRLTKEYLEIICPHNKIDVLTGRLTALLRRHWMLNNILHGHNEMGNTPNMKNRDDHRHHAVDAIVIGMTTRSMLQKVARAAKRAEELRLERLFHKDENGRSPIEPWANFRSDVAKIMQSIIVSHKANRKLYGQLHKEFTYGFASKDQINELSDSEKDHPIKADVVLRKSVNELKQRKHVAEIRDTQLRNDFLMVFDKAKKEGVRESDAVNAYALTRGIRRLRVQNQKTVQPIRDKQGNIYKAFWLRGNWATEVYVYPTHHHKKAGQWESKTISRYEANQPDFDVNNVKDRLPHPAARLIMRLFADDFLEIEENGRKRLMRVQKMSNGNIYICEHQEANVAERLTELVKNNIAIQASANRLKQLNARKVHVSPTGLVNYEKKQRPETKKKFHERTNS